MNFKSTPNTVTKYAYHICAIVQDSIRVSRQYVAHQIILKYQLHMVMILNELTQYPWRMWNVLQQNDVMETVMRR